MRAFFYSTSFVKLICSFGMHFTVTFHNYGTGLCGLHMKSRENGLLVVFHFLNKNMSIIEKGHKTGDRVSLKCFRFLVSTIIMDIMGRSI
jgi:hypothetical protein